MDFVLYHANCTDGMGAYYAAWRKFGDKAQYFPVSYKEEPPVMVAPTGEEENVYIVDFSYSAAVLRDMAEVYDKIVILDHHKTAQEDLKDLKIPNVEIVFDMNRSGAVIAWDYFHPDKPAPELLKYVQDRDLWKFELPYSREITAALNVVSPDVNVWHDLVNRDTNAINNLLAQGEAITKANNQLIERALKQVAFIEFCGFWVPSVNSTVLMSELGEAMLKAKPEAQFSLTYIIRDKGIVQFSLRSRVGSNCDVSIIAEAYGGGGHKHASGFITDLKGLSNILK